jgi:hypothetical protein
MDIAAAARAQMLGQLIDAVAPAAGTAQRQAGGLSPSLAAALAAGRTMTATVLGEIAGGRIALQLGGQAVAAEIRGAALPAGALRPGATLALSVESGGATPSLALAGFEPPPPGFTRTPPPRAPADAPLVRLAGAPETRPPIPGAAAAATPLQAALREALPTAAARQGGAAPLYADLGALAARPGVDLPEPVARIASLLLGSRLDAERTVTPEALRQAVATAAGGSADAPDLKTLLATLKALLPAAADATAAPRAEQRPEPPRGDSPPVAQKPAAPALPPDADSKLAATILRQEAEQALERAKLHAYAGLPEARPGAPGEAPRQTHLQVEIPLAFGQQTAMMGLKVERDARRKDADGAPVDVWGVRFAIETDEIGAVHAHLRLAGRALSVSLWAEDRRTRAAFAEALPLLEAALRDGALEVGELAVFAGRPQEPTRAASGHFLDVSS